MTTTEIPNYLKFPVTYPEEVQLELRTLNEIALRDGWRQAIDQVYRSIPDRIQYTTILVDSGLSICCH